MSEALHISTNALLAFSTYLVGTMSPGPSNLAVMAAAMETGRKRALVLALGVVSGSLFWGLIAAFGLAAIIAMYAEALIAMKILGGSYLLWLAFKSARSAMSAAPARPGQARHDPASLFRTYFQGAGLHLTNPKAIFVWLSIVSLALPRDAETRDALVIVAGCGVLGLFVFCGYALAFSTATARRVYASLRRWFECSLALVFGYAGLRMLLSIR